MEVNKWTGDETVAVKDVIAMLNELHQLNPELMTDFTLKRFPCNHAIRDHKTVQAFCYGDASLEEPKVGLVGLLNGLLGIDRNHFGPIAAILEEEDGSLTGFTMTDTDAMTKKIESGTPVMKVTREFTVEKREGDKE